MKIIKKLSAMVCSAILVLAANTNAIADSTGEVISLGANLNASQKASILSYFGVDESNPNIIYVNNQQERKYLAGIAPAAQLGHVTMSSSYVVPTSSGGINVKTSNITWVTSSMIATTLSTAGVENANVVAAAPFPVSGTGALTGIIIGFEKSTGDNLTEAKKKLANQELVTTGQLANQIGQEKATGIINDAKKEVIKDDLNNKSDIEKAVKDAAQNYNVNLNTGDINVIVNLLKEVGNQNYNYNDMKDRKSTRLNSSHANLVCRLLLEKKKKASIYWRPNRLSPWCPFSINPVSSPPTNTTCLPQQLLSCPPAALSLAHFPLFPWTQHRG